MEKTVDTVDAKQLSQRIKELRTLRHLTQSEIAKKLNLSRSRLVQIESGLASPIPHLHKFVEIFGSEITNLFSYDINYYTNHRLLLYMLCFGVNYPTVGAILGLSISKIKKLVLNPEKKYLLQYKEKIDVLFPDMKKIDFYDRFEKIGVNSLHVIINGKDIVFLNVLGNDSNDEFANIANYKL